MFFYIFLFQRQQLQKKEEENKLHFKLALVGVVGFNIGAAADHNSNVDVVGVVWFLKPHTLFHNPHFVVVDVVVVADTLLVSRTFRTNNIFCFCLFFYFL